ncbi:hypothetical protein LTR64_003557 [Lithohypha guttulata]|uniref:uncharacterized protein n=1 Tax=Lithohypha guttulata TaxID=1690604 RepID=UPI00315DC606
MEVFLGQAKTMPDVPVPDQKLLVTNLPAEVIDEICSYLFQGDTFNVSVLRRTTSKPSRRLLCGFPSAISNLNSLMHANSLLRERTRAYVSRKARFYANTEEFDDLPTAFGSANASLIRYLNLQCFNAAKRYGKFVWPRLHGMIRLHLPNLEKLELWSYSYNNYYLESGTEPAYMTTRQQEDHCCLMKFAAFLKHPNLKRIVAPARYRPYFEVDGGQARSKIILDAGYQHRNWEGQLRRPNATDTEPEVLVKDQVLNATLIRQIKRVDLPRTPFETLVLEPPTGQTEDVITTSEVPSQVSIYTFLEERAYKTKDEHAQRGWAWRDNDELIVFCEQMNGVSDLDKAGLVQTIVSDRDQSYTEKCESDEKQKDADYRIRSLELTLEYTQERSDRLEEQLERAQQENDEINGMYNELYNEKENLGYENELLQRKMRQLERVVHRLGREKEDWVDVCDALEMLYGG